MASRQRRRCTLRPRRLLRLARLKEAQLIRKLFVEPPQLLGVLDRELLARLFCGLFIVAHRPSALEVVVERGALLRVRLHEPRARVCMPS